MSEPFRPYEKLVEITVFGKKFQVPERNSLLRCFQFISPETIPYGRFCWNQDCQYCRVSCQLPDEDEPHEMLRQIHRNAGDGDYRNEPGAEVVPALEAALGHAGHFLRLRFFLKSEVDSRQLKVEREEEAEKS
jgi:hypothetical protein